MAGVRTAMQASRDRVEPQQTWCGAGEVERRHQTLEVGVEEERSRQAICFGGFDNAMRSGREQAGGPGLQHIPDVNHKRVGDGRRLHLHV